MVLNSVPAAHFALIFSDMSSFEHTFALDSEYCALLWNLWLRLHLA